MSEEKEILERIDTLMKVIPYCKTRKEAEEIQDEISELETELFELN